MKRSKIIIMDNEKVIVPSEVRMNISEIADLFGIFHQTAKRHIRAIEKSGVAGGDYSMSSTCQGAKVYPDYYGLEMIIALTFRVQSAEADVFRKWLLHKAIKTEVLQIPKNLLFSVQNPNLN